MTNLALEFIARLAGLAVGYFIIGAVLAWREVRADVRARVALRPSTGSPYRAPFSDTGLAPTAEPGEAWQAGVAAERARVLGLVRAVKGASCDSAVQRACEAIVAGVEGGAK